MNNAIAIDDLPPEKIIDVLQEVDKNIVKLTEFVQSLRLVQNKLNSKKNKVTDDEIRLANVRDELDRSLKELDEQYEFAKRLLAKIQQHVSRIINNENVPGQNRNVTDCAVKPDGKPRGLSSSTSTDSCSVPSGELYKAVILTRDDRTKDYNNVMVLRSTDDFAEDLRSIDRSDCTLLSGRGPGNSLKGSCCRPSCTKVCQKTVVSAEKECNANAIIKHEIRNLNQHLGNIINVNQDLRLELRNAIQQNDLMERALMCPAPFKYSAKEGVRFPGKKEMEVKLFAMKSIILQLHDELREVQINQAKLKLAKKIIDQHSDEIINCQCDRPADKNDIDMDIKVKKQQIRLIAMQIKTIDSELNNIQFQYECTIKMNQKNVARRNQLYESLMDLKKKIEEYDNENDIDMADELKKTNEEIVTLELLHRERLQQLYDNDIKLRKVQCDAKQINCQTQQLENSLKQLSVDFNTIYNNSRTNYKGQLVENLALPTILIATQIKLQQELDLHMLAEETKCKLEQEIKQAEADNLNEPVQHGDLTEQIRKLDAENKKWESNVNALRDNIESVTGQVANGARELDAATESVRREVAESDKQLSAFNNFSAIHLDKITGDLNATKELLAKLQGEECKKTNDKHAIMDFLETHVNSIFCKMERCISEVRSFTDG